MSAETDKKDDSLESHPAAKATRSEYPGVTSFTDFKIVCQGAVFHVHKVTLVLGSSFFEKALISNFTEANADMMSLDDEDPDLLWIVLRYFYYRPSKERFKYDQSEDSLMQHAQLYALCDRLDVQELKTLVQDEFEALLTSNFSRENFPDVISEVYSTTLDSDRGLREPIVEIVRKNLKEVSRNDKFFKMMENNGCFGRDVLKSSVGFITTVATSTYRCPSCTRVFDAFMGQGKYGTEYCHFCPKSYNTHEWARYIVS